MEYIDLMLYSILFNNSNNLNYHIQDNLHHMSNMNSLTSSIHMNIEHMLMMKNIINNPAKHQNTKNNYHYSNIIQEDI